MSKSWLTVNINLQIFLITKTEHTSTKRKPFSMNCPLRYNDKFNNYLPAANVAISKLKKKFLENYKQDYTDFISCVISSNLPVC